MKDWRCKKCGNEWNSRKKILKNEKRRCPKCFSYQILDLAEERAVEEWQSIDLMKAKIMAMKRLNFWLWRHRRKG